MAIKFDGYNMRPCIESLEADIARLTRDRAALLKIVRACSHALRSYQYGNVATDLAEEMADYCDKAIALCEAPSTTQGGK